MCIPGPDKRYDIIVIWCSSEDVDRIGNVWVDLTDTGWDVVDYNSYDEKYMSAKAVGIITNINGLVLDDEFLDLVAYATSNNLPVYYIPIY